MQNFPTFSSNQELQLIYENILNSVAEISQVLRNQQTDQELQSQNDFGDKQLDIDVKSDDIIFKNLINSQLVEFALSEEKPSVQFYYYNQLQPCGGKQFIVTFDPLDGSSIIGCNWTVGSIFGIWKNSNEKLIGRTGRDLLGSIIGVYGFKTSALIYNDIDQKVQEITLRSDKWQVTKHDCNIKPNCKIFAPGNLRASNEDTKYRNLINYWIDNRYTLRYTGGMVPDIYQIFIKGEGIFVNLPSQKAPSKLRYLYEVAPFAYLIEKANGQASDGSQSILDIQIIGYDQRGPIIVGSSDEVQRVHQFMN